MTTPTAAAPPDVRHRRSGHARQLGTHAVLGLSIAGALVSVSAKADAQTRPRAAIEASAGALRFIDDGDPSETMVGGSVRWYLTDRIAVGPEVLYVQGAAHHHTVVTANVVWDVIPETTRRAVRPFVVAGGGVFQTHRTFDGMTFETSDAAFTAGGGLRVRVNPRLRLGSEIRVGHPWHVRASGFVGVALGR